MLKFTILGETDGWRRLRLDLGAPDQYEPVNQIPVDYVGATALEQSPYVGPLLDWLGYVGLPELDRVVNAGQDKETVHCFGRPSAWPEMTSGEREIAAGCIVEECDRNGVCLFRALAAGVTADEPEVEGGHPPEGGSSAPEVLAAAARAEGPPPEVVEAGAE